MNEKIKIGMIVGGIWGFMCGILLVSSHLGGIPDKSNSSGLINLIFLPYYISANIEFSISGILSKLDPITFIIILLGMSTLIGTIIGGLASAIILDTGKK